MWRRIMVRFRARAAGCGAAAEARRDQDSGCDGVAGAGHRYRRCRSGVPDARPRAVAVAMQRVAGRGTGAGRFPRAAFSPRRVTICSRQAALVRKMRAGELDRLEIPPQPMDVLMQQMVAACGGGAWEKDRLLRCSGARIRIASSRGSSLKSAGLLMQRHRVEPRALWRVPDARPRHMGGCMRGAGPA